MRSFVHVAAIVCAVSLLGGCAVEPDIDGPTSAEFQTSVVSIAELAASGDPTSALSQLQNLESALHAAMAEGRVSSERGAEISGAIALVRADLTASVEAVPVPLPPEPVTDGDNGDQSDKNEDKGNDKDKNKGKGKKD